MAFHEVRFPANLSFGSVGGPERRTEIVTLANVDATGFTAYTSGGTATPVQWTKISNVKSYTGFDGSASEIERTNFDSTAKEFILGLFDPGDLGDGIPLIGRL